jgi:phosphatidylserine decarboxylase
MATWGSKKERNKTGPAQRYGTGRSRPERAGWRAGGLDRAGCLGTPYADRMTASPARPEGGSLTVRRVALGDPAARTLVDELARRRGPATGLLVGAGAGAGWPVVAAAIASLPPAAALTVVPAGGSGLAADPAADVAADVAAALAAAGDRNADRVRVVDALADAEPADVVVLAEPLTGTADEARARLRELEKHLREGGVLVAAVVAMPGLEGAAAELDRQDALFGVGADLVLRNTPPVRVHRLRYTPAEPAAAERLAPACRTSSVPLTRQMHIDSNGVAAAGIALGLAALARLGRRRPSSRGARLWLLPAVAALPVAAFFRDPQREVPADDAAVVAACDGRVLSVERLRDRRFSDGDLLRVAVFLSVLDVHVNRSPVAGRVSDFFVTDGGFAAAMNPAAEHNVAAYTVLDTTRGPVVVAQRTGLIARRIVQRAPVGALLAKGERFGLIRFGSRTDVYLPADQARAVVGPGDRVLGGSSVIARWL